MNAVQFFYQLACTPGQFTRGASEKVNTCNGWGFDGWFGQAHQFEWNGHAYILRVGDSPNRHGQVFKVFVVVDADNVFRKWKPKKFLENCSQGLDMGRGVNDLD
jgi:hypothetical protein